MPKTVMSSEMRGVTFFLQANIVAKAMTPATMKFRTAPVTDSLKKSSSVAVTRASANTGIK